MRRDFLKRCALAGLGLAMPFRLPSSLRAESKEKDNGYEGPFYVVLNASGGWDTTYLMDPKGIEGINRLYQEGDILTRGNHKFAPTEKHKSGGMSNEEFYAEFGDQLLVLNGLDYSVNNHSPGARYMATGKIRDRKIGHEALITALHFSVPYLSVSPVCQKDIFNAT